MKRILITIILFMSISFLFSQTAEDYYKMGLEQDRLGQSTKAEEYFRKSLEVDPNYHLSIFEYAKMYIRARSYDLALTELNKVINLAPEFPDAYMERGNIYLQYVDHTKACKDFKKAQQLGNKKAKEYLDQYCK
jgi:Tfp pilus assembly protein PilF